MRSSWQPCNHTHVLGHLSVPTLVTLYLAAFSWTGSQLSLVSALLHWGIQQGAASVAPRVQDRRPR